MRREGESIQRLRKTVLSKTRAKGASKRGVENRREKKEAIRSADAGTERYCPFFLGREKDNT